MSHSEPPGHTGPGSPWRGGPLALETQPFFRYSAGVGVPGRRVRPTGGVAVVLRQAGTSVDHPSVRNKESAHGIDPKDQQFFSPSLCGTKRRTTTFNLEYVRAAKALGVSNLKIMFRHMLPNAMVATLTMLPFVITGTISLLAGLDFLGFGLPSSSPSLGELTLQAKQNLQAPWLAFTAFFAFAIMLSLLVFIFEGIRDAFDPRKTFE